MKKTTARGVKGSIVVDIDGCLNHYPNPLKMWAEMMLNLNDSESGQAIEKENDFELLKKTYRHSQLLNHMLPRAGASEVLGQIRKNGYSIVLLTARNPKKNSRIKKITENWLKKNKIPFDSILFIKDKVTYLKENEDQIVILVEDDPNYLRLCKGLKTEVVAFENDLNRGFKRKHFRTVSSWQEIGGLFSNLVSK